MHTYVHTYIRTYMRAFIPPDNTKNSAKRGAVSWRVSPWAPATVARQAQAVQQHVLRQGRGEAQLVERRGARHRLELGLGGRVGGQGVPPAESGPL